MAMYGFEMKASVVESRLTGPMKGGLYENLVAGMLRRAGYSLHYWRSQSGSREIEFLIQGGDASIVPIEVKAGRGLRFH